MPQDRISPQHPLLKLFRAAVDQALRPRRELRSPRLVQYLGNEVLGGFVHVDRLFRLRNARGKRLEDLPEILEVVSDQEGPERRFEADQYIGDFALFMAGFFPEAIQRRGWFVPRPMIARVGRLFVRFSDPVDYYAAEGRSAYQRAAEEARWVEPDLGPLLGRLGERFEDYLTVMGDVKENLWNVQEVRQLERLLGS